jgi:hypothetical protein
LQIKLTDTGLDKVTLDIHQKDPKPIASEVTDNIMLHFIGSICPSGQPGSMKCMKAFGAEYFISGEKSKSITDLMWYPAWMVPAVNDDKATFEYRDCTLYFNWPESMELPKIDEVAYKKHDPHGAEPEDMCDVHIEVTKPDLPDEARGTPTDSNIEGEEAEAEEDPVTIYWTVTIPCLVPKDEFIGKRDVPITRPRWTHEVQKVTKKKCLTEAASDADPEPISLKKASSMMGAQASRSMVDRMSLQARTPAPAGKAAVAGATAGLSKDLTKRAKHLLK